MYCLIRFKTAYLSSFPIHSSGNMYLILQVGYAMLAGLCVLLVITPINVLLVRWCRSASKQGMAEKDKRMKLMNEILNGIKVVYNC